ncbi:MAG: histone deacetylase [Bdellovibrio sp.]|nr:histone deacetylase [Bdellovibrio sp.]
MLLRKTLKLWFLVTLCLGCQSLPTSSSSQDPLKKPVVLAWNPVAMKHTRLGLSENHLRSEVLQQVVRESFPGVQSREVLREASPDELAAFHTQRYIEEIKNTDVQKKFYRQDRWSPYVTSFAYSAAASAAAVTTDLLKDVYLGKAASGFALVRPPGHHAVSDGPLGLCLFNNIAVAVKNLQRNHPHVKVAIVDIDAHHGNGIQDAFYETDQVLYVSTHQDSWPWSGKLELSGEGKGRGTTINIPLPARSGDQTYAKVFAEIIVPAVKRFSPDILVVAQGYDSHWKDPQSFLQMTSTGQAELAQNLVELARQVTHGKVVFVLEGGYQLDVLKDGLHNTVNALRGVQEVFDTMGPPMDVSEPDVRKLLQRLKKVHKL